MIDRLRQMAIFAKTIDHGSFRGAAKELKLSPSVISHHISELEDHLGVTLVYRSTRKLTITQDGKRLLIAARQMLDAVEGELRDITGSAQDPSGELRISLPSVLSQSALTDSIAQFMTAYPRINLTVDYSDTRKELIDDGFDVAIRMLLDPAKFSNSRKLFEVDRRLISSCDYLRNQSEVQMPRDLQDWDWLLLSPVHSRGIQFHHHEMPTQKVKPRTRFMSNDALAMFRLISKGVGIAALPEFLSTEGIENGNLAYVLPDWKLDKLHVFVEWPANATKHGLIHLLVNSLSEYTY
ncbi:MAG: LysR family transcriptional regulator [Hellea sp.]